MPTSAGTALRRAERSAVRRRPTRHHARRSGQWYLRAPDATLLSAINAEAAWAHHHRVGRAWSWRCSTPACASTTPTCAAASCCRATTSISRRAATANDGNGRDADASDPGDWISAAENARSGSFAAAATDSSWHGTQTAGLIGAATDNGIGMAGVGRNVMVLPVRVLGKCGGYDSDIQAGDALGGRARRAGRARQPAPGARCST